MPAPLTLTEHVLIERAVWTLDTYVQSLPGRSRKGIRRELRANLRAAAQDVGAEAAVRQLGNLRRLAADYLDAAYGEDKPRPSLRQAVFWAVAVEAAMFLATAASFDSFLAGAKAAGDDAVGSHVLSWPGFFGVNVTIFYDRDGFSGFELSASLLRFFLTLAVAFFVGGRYWRLLPLWWRSRRAVPAQPS